MLNLGVDCATALCSALAAVGHCICTEPVHPDGLTAFVACRLIPLDKQPGVCLTGIGEVPRCIILKAMPRLVDMDICDACGALQVCAGCEAAVHAMRQLFQDARLHAALLVDTSNALILLIGKQLFIIFSDSAHLLLKF